LFGAETEVAAADGVGDDDDVSEMESLEELAAAVLNSLSEAVDSDVEDDGNEIGLDMERDPIKLLEDRER
jgi:hypothetical protein